MPTRPMVYRLLLPVSHSRHLYIDLAFPGREFSVTVRTERTMCVLRRQNEQLTQRCDFRFSVDHHLITTRSQFPQRAPACSVTSRNSSTRARLTMGAGRHGQRRRGGGNKGHLPPPIPAGKCTG